MTNFVYFVHDLDDPAVERRVRMLAPHIDGSIVVLGFYRGERAPVTLGGARVISLGRTHHARLGRRVVSVLGAVARLRTHKKTLAEADLIIARLVETLSMAVIARRLFSRRSVPIVYECLDIHTIMVGDRFVGRTMRRLERNLLRQCAGLIVSSPAFLWHHFERLNTPLPRIWVVENKVLETEVEPRLTRLMAERENDEQSARRAWRIGWFGYIRCRRSMNLLVDLCRKYPELVEITIAGRVMDDQIPNFDDLVSSVPNMNFGGIYDRTIDLPALYHGVDFSWTMDFYQQGFNSDWLLPNRIYEGPLYGAVPIAMSGTQTADWLTAHGIGIILPEPIESTLPSFVDEMNSNRLTRLRSAIEDIPLSDLVCGTAEERSLASGLLDLIKQHGFT